MIAYHFPPYSGSSGIQRTLSFARYLPDYGWHPIILTAQERAYPQIDRDSLLDVPQSMIISRAFALDSARHLSVKGRYLRCTALPDRWASWILGAIPSGLALIQRHRPAVLWSTYPIATAHVIGAILHSLTGLPWVADFRDPMTEGETGDVGCFPQEQSLWQVRRRIEGITVRHCSRVVMVSPGALRSYMHRYAHIPRSKWSLIANGYDERSFENAVRLIEPKSLHNAPITLIHSGLLYPMHGDRDPSSFFLAIEMLKSRNVVCSATLKVKLRASGNETEFHTAIQKHGIGDIVSIEPAIPYAQALAEMLQASGLLIFQGPVSNANIPAKLYEYLRARRPIFAMVDKHGDTAEVLREAGVGWMVPIDDPSKIAEGLISFLDQLKMGTAPILESERVHGYSREARAAELATLLDQTVRLHHLSEVAAIS